MNYAEICKKYNLEMLSGADLSWADLSGADLSGADLSGAKLSEANLSGSDLFRAKLFRTKLFRTNLSGTNLSEANLSEANLSGANLSGANLSEANLSGTNLSGTNLSGANLYETNLFGANLFGAILKNTCLDPTNKPNGMVEGFERMNSDYIVGYRTEKAGHIDIYRIGQFYSADWFSTASTECHPGLYLWPTLDLAMNFSKDVPMIKVRTKADMVHKAGSKWRCKWFEVLEKI